MARPSRPLSEIELPTNAQTIAGSAQSGSSFGSSTLKPHQTFGKFEIQEELGRGGMGVVFRARQTDLKRDVAIKIIRSHHLADREELRRFQVEAQAAARLKHSNIVAVHEIGEIEGQHYFAMEKHFPTACKADRWNSIRRLHCSSRSLRRCIIFTSIRLCTVTSNPPISYSTRTTNRW